jgi:hypothetical protein
MVAAYFGGFSFQHEICIPGHHFNAITIYQQAEASKPHASAK